MIALTGPAAANVKLASHCVIRSHRFYSKMSTSVGIQMCLILLTCNSPERLLCNRLKRCDRLNLELWLIWQFIGSSGLLKLAEAIWPEKIQKERALLCVSVAAWCSRGSMSQGLTKRSHGILQLKSLQLYRQPQVQTECQWGCKHECKRKQTPQGYLWWTSAPTLGIETLTRVWKVRSWSLSPSVILHICGWKKNDASALWTFLIVGSIILLKPFKAISADMVWREGKPLPACSNLLHCYPEQLYPFFNPVWLIHLLYW